MAAWTLKKDLAIRKQYLAKFELLATAVITQWKSDLEKTGKPQTYVNTDPFINDVLFNPIAEKAFRSYMLEKYDLSVATFVPFDTHKATHIAWSANTK